MTVLQRAFDIVKAKMSPDTIPLSGPRTRGQDYYSVHLYPNNSDEEVMLFDDVVLDGVRVRVWDEATNSKSKHLELAWESVSKYRPRFYHYYNGWQFVYVSSLKFVIFEYTKLYRAEILFEGVKQRLFNFKPMAYKGRMDALIRFVDATDSMEEQQLSLAAFISFIHGRRWFSHPKEELLRRKYKRILNSLVESGELKKDLSTANYVVTAKALVTIATFEVEERKHRQMIFVQWLLAIIAIFALIAAMLQAITSYGQYQLQKQDRLENAVINIK